MRLEIFLIRSNKFKILALIMKHITEKNLIVFILGVCNI